MYLLKRCGKFKFDIAAGCKRTPKAELIQMDIVKKVRGSVQPLPQRFSLLFIMILTYKKIHLNILLFIGSILFTCQDIVIWWLSLKHIIGWNWRRKNSKHR